MPTEPPSPTDLEPPPEPHPEPPEELLQISLPTVESASSWYRLHPAEYDPLFFGCTARNRFDAPDGSFGVLYVGEDPLGAFIETFGHHTGRTGSVTRQALAAKDLARVDSSRPLHLVDLTASGLAHLHADDRLTSGPIGLAQRWSHLFHRHPSAPDGVLYRCRHDPERVAAALYDRIAPDLEATSLGALSEPTHRGLLGEILHAYGFGLI